MAKWTITIEGESDQGPDVAEVVYTLTKADKIAVRRAEVVYHNNDNDPDSGNEFCTCPVSKFPNFMAYGTAFDCPVHGHDACARGEQQ